MPLCERAYNREYKARHSRDHRHRHALMFFGSYQPIGKYCNLAGLLWTRWDSGSDHQAIFAVHQSEGQGWHRSLSLPSLCHGWNQVRIPTLLLFFACKRQKFCFQVRCPIQAIPVQFGIRTHSVIGCCSLFFLQLIRWAVLYSTYVLTRRSWMPHIHMVHHHFRFCIHQSVW